jgi:hypothetical protein
MVIIRKAGIRIVSPCALFDDGNLNKTLLNLYDNTQYSLYKKTIYTITPKRCAATKGNYRLKKSGVQPNKYAARTHKMNKKPSAWHHFVE